MRTQELRIICSCLLFLLASSLTNAKPLIIVKNHLPKAVIVLSDSTNKQLLNAAKLMQEYIRQSTDAILPIALQPRSSDISIHIGTTPYVKSKRISRRSIDEDGFILKKTDNLNFVIVGGSDWGTEFGVYAFLERYVGVLWLMPTDIGADVPKLSTLTLPEETVKESPAYISREISPYSVSNKENKFTWPRFNRFRGRIAFHHNLTNLLDPKKFGKSNPEFYSLSEGNAEISGDDKWQPNFSAPGIIDTSSAEIINYFKQNPNVTSYSLGINDNTIFDRSPTSRARRNGEKNYLGFENVSDDYFQWVNGVVEKVTKVYPDKKFGVLAYINVSSPPSASIGVDPHVIPFLCYERMRWADPSLLNAGHQLTLEWAKMCPALGWYDYVYGLDYLVPRVWFHQMQQYLSWGSKHNVKYYYAELYPNWGEGPKPWLLSKLLWNPNQDVDSLLNVWYVRTGGEKAAPKLKQFYDIWENFWTKDILNSKWNTDKNTYLPYFDISYLGSVPNDYISRSDLLMEEAYQLAETDIQKKRVAELRKMWKLYQMAAQNYTNTSGSLDNKRESLISSPEFVNLLNDLKNDPLHSESINRIMRSLKIK